LGLSFHEPSNTTRFSSEGNAAFSKRILRGARFQQQPIDWQISAGQLMIAMHAKNERRLSVNLEMGAPAHRRQLH
jgi:hypothetical protein